MEMIATKHSNEGTKNETDNQNNFANGKPELSLTIKVHSEEID